MGELRTVVFVGTVPAFREYLAEQCRMHPPSERLTSRAGSVTIGSTRYIRFTGAGNALRGLNGPAELVCTEEGFGPAVEAARAHIAIMNCGTPHPTPMSFYVHGRPAPQGSKRISPTGAMREQSPYLVGWAGGWKGSARLGKRIHGAVEVAVYRWYQEHNIHPAALLGGYIKGPVDVSIVFYLDPAHGPIDEPPDVDKLARATFDALTAARAWADDGRVIDATLRKRHADPDHPAGAYIMIREATL